MSNQIEMYFHCGKCINELPKDVSPKEYARLSIGRTKDGLQIWCNRHDAEIAHFFSESYVKWNDRQ